MISEREFPELKNNLRIDLMGEAKSGKEPEEINLRLMRKDGK